MLSEEMANVVGGKGKCHRRNRQMVSEEKANVVQGKGKCRRRKRPMSSELFLAISRKTFQYLLKERLQENDKEFGQFLLK